MKKSEQIEINKQIEEAIFEINENIEAFGVEYKERLRTCNARVYHTPFYLILESYNTYVAAIDLRTRTLYDFLRLIYGYASTSAQHIAKFSDDYNAQKILRYYK